MLGNDKPRSGGGSQAKRAQARLRRHAELTEKYVKEGMGRVEASKKAFEDIVGPCPRTGSMLTRRTVRIARQHSAKQREVAQDVKQVCNCKFSRPSVLRPGFCFWCNCLLPENKTNG